MRQLRPVTAILLGLVACSAGQAPAPEQGAPRPKDFAVEYEWRVGSLPPPHHYEYSIRVDPSGQAEIAMVPDYPSKTALRWTERFTLPSEALDRLYRSWVGHGLFRRAWREEQAPMVGGKLETLTVTAGGRRVTVADVLIAEQRPSAEAIYAALNALVPTEVRANLERRRQQYVEDHRKRGR